MRRSLKQFHIVVWIKSTQKHLSDLNCNWTPYSSSIAALILNNREVSSVSSKFMPDSLKRLKLFVDKKSGRGKILLPLFDEIRGVR
jgi:hypothetical protein